MDDPRHGNPAPWQQHAQPQPYAPVVAPKARPNHVLHLLLTVLSCGMWSVVWITLTARYWNVVDYRNPVERPGMDRRAAIAVGVIAVLTIGGGIIGSLAPDSTTAIEVASAQPTTAATTTAAQSKAPAKAAAPAATKAEPVVKEEPAVKAPKGVAVSGDYAEILVIRSFKPTRDVFGWLQVDLRVKNPSDEDLEYLSIKVVALRGEDVIATADGLIESIDAGQTITTRVSGADDFPRNRKGITYEIEIE